MCKAKMVGMKRRQWSFVTATQADTVAIAQSLARSAFAGAVLTLEGELGVGKTRFVQAFAHALGIRQAVRSPTFVLIHEYEDGRLPLVHMDMYRVEQPEAELGLEEYWCGDAVCVIEWASQIAEALPVERLELRIRYVPEQGEETRHWDVVACGESYEMWFAPVELLDIEDVSRKEAGHADRIGCSDQ